MRSLPQHTAARLPIQKPRRRWLLGLYVFLAAFASVSIAGMAIASHILTSQAEMRDTARSPSEDGVRTDFAGLWKYAEVSGGAGRTSHYATRQNDIAYAVDVTIVPKGTVDAILDQDIRNITSGLVEGTSVRSVRTMFLDHPAIRYDYATDGKRTDGLLTLRGDRLLHIRTTALTFGEKQGRIDAFFRNLAFTD